MRARRVASAFAIVAAACATVGFLAAGSSHAQAQTQTRWCTKVPLEQSFCPALTVEAPRSTLRLAVADTDAQRTRGLMDVRHIPAGEGMLFVFPDIAGAHHEFWMKDTLVPLDMIFVESDGVVSSVFENVPVSKPGASDNAVARRAGTGRYVIELAAGAARRAGLTVGTRLPIPSAFASVTR